MRPYRSLIRLKKRHRSKRVKLKLQNVCAIAIVSFFSALPPFFELVKIVLVTRNAFCSQLHLRIFSVLLPYFLNKSKSEK